MALTRPRAAQIYDIDYKQATRVVTVANVTLTGGAPSSVDGVNLSLNDRVLVTGQSTLSQNGVYYVTTLGSGSNGTWSRSLDTNNTGEILSGTIVMVTEGTIYADTQWKLITDGIIDVGVTDQVWTQNYSANSISSGNSNVVVNANANVTVSSAGVANVLNITATGPIVTGNLLPSANITYDLGSSNLRWKDLWLSNSTLYIGNVTIAATATTLTVNGSNVLTGTQSGDILTGGNVSATGNVTGGNLLTGGNVSATGNATAGNILTAGLISATGNATSGNLLTAGVVSGTGNITGGNILTAGIVSATGNLTAGNISTLGSFGAAALSAAGNVTGGNLVTSGVVTSTGNVIGGNVLTAGIVSATANVTGGNLTTGGQVSATANVIGGNVLTAGEVSATGNATAGNVLTGGIVSATGNATAGNLTTGGQVSATANVIGGNVLTAGIVSATGNITGDYFLGNVFYANGITASKIYSGNSEVNVTSSGGNVNVSIGGTSNVVVFSTEGEYVTGLLSVSGNITGGNVLFGSGIVSGTGNITGNVITSTTLNSTTVSASGNITGGNVLFGSGVVSGTGNITGNVITSTTLNSTTVSASGNITSGNVTTGGLISATGNVSGNNFLGNVVATTVSATGNVIGGNIVTAGSGGDISGSGNITAGNILTGGQVSATGNVNADYLNANIYYATGFSASKIFSGNSEVNVTASGGNVNVSVGGTSNVAVFSTLGEYVTGLISASGNATAGNVLTGGQVSAGGNITSSTNVNTPNVVGATGLVLSTSGNANINLTPAGTGNIVVNNRYINGIAQPVQDNDAASKIYVDNRVSTQIAYHQAVTAATTANLATTTGGTITYAQPNGAANGIGATITTTGSFNLIDTANVQTANTRILVKNEGNAVLNGVYIWSNATVITRSTDADQYGPNSAEELSINDYFFVTGGNVNAGSAWIVDAPAGTITFGTSNIVFAQFSSSQTYTGGNGISLYGTVISTVYDNSTIGVNGSNQLYIPANAPLTTPNIGAATGTSLSATGAVTAGTNLSAVANVIAGNITTVGVITATGNITTAGDLNGANLSLSGNVLSALNVTGNITGGNILTSGIMSSTGNATAGNVLTGGLVSATGNITTVANIIGGNVTTTGLVTATGNVTAGNLTTGGLVTATGNATAGNILTAGVVSATGNVTGNYFIGNASQVTGVNTFSQIFVTGATTVNAASLTSNVTFTAGANIALTSDGNIITIAYSATGSTSIFATGGDMGLISQAVTESEDLGNVIDLPSTSYDLGTLFTVTTVNQLDVTGFTGNVNAANVNLTGLITATGNITGGNILTAGLVSATANVTGGNILTGGLVSAGGNVTGNYILGNGSQLTGISAGSSNNSITITTQNITANYTIATGQNGLSVGPMNTANGVQVTVADGQRWIIL
jgi:hypothetical protein